jgi:nucleoside-diphosphate-sugar epimerase
LGVRRVLVTGGAGFIGAHLVRALLARGDTVRVLDNMATGSAQNLSAALGRPLRHIEQTLATGAGGCIALAERCEVVVGDIRDPGAVETACRGAEVMFHQAALRSVPQSFVDPVGTVDVNVKGTQCVLEAARREGVRRLVFASSSAVYGDTPLPKAEHQVPQPKSPYAASKLAGEALCQAYSKSFGLSTVSLRYFNAFGPWQDPTSEYAAVVPKFFKLALRGEALPVHGDGSQSRDFTYVDNVVAANLLAADADVDSVALNVGAGCRHSILDLVHTIGRIIGRTPECAHVAPRAGDVRHSEADIRRARELIGYEPIIDFELGLSYTYDAMRDEAPSQRFLYTG